MSDLSTSVFRKRQASHTLKNENMAVMETMVK